MTTLVTMTQKQYEMLHLLDHRRRLIERARRAVQGDDLQGAVIDLLNIVEGIQVNDERYVELHRECLALLEHAGKILALDASLRPVVVHVEAPAPPDQSKDP